jgi:hypothetical protein
MRIADWQIHQLADNLDRRAPFENVMDGYVGRTRGPYSEPRPRESPQFTVKFVSRGRGGAISKVSG